jgi:putative ABC transport system substrate-binding protein
MKTLTGKFIFLFLTAGSFVYAQQPTKVPRIGFLSLTSLSNVSTRLDAFHQGLRELGYKPGENIAIELRWAKGNEERLPSLAAELVRLNVDVFVTPGPQPTRAAKAASATKPIVMVQDTDPVGNGFVASLARPNGNITGLAALSSDLCGKRLEILKESVPRISRVAVFGTSALPGNAQAVKDTELAARAFKLQVNYIDVLAPKDIETAFQAAIGWRAHATFLLDSAVLDSHRALTVDLAARNHLPAMYPQEVFIHAGGLMYYGASGNDLFRRAASYVDKILKGRTPADLPVERPKKAEFIINLKAAKQIGLTIPPEVLQRADRVIE